MYKNVDDEVMLLLNKRCIYVENDKDINKILK